jgi:ribulose-phosphate 3-epimerase
MNITPAILPHLFEEVVEKLSRVEGIANHVQIDLCDGVFGREKTWLPLGTEKLSAAFSYEFDIMLNEWELYMMHAITIGGSSVVAHVDVFTDEDIATLISIVGPRGVKLGIAVSNDKSLEYHAEMVRKIKALYPKVFIQVMGIRNIGEQGQVFDEDAVMRIKALKQQFGDITIQVDGGITPETAVLVGNAGAETLVVGSFIFGSEDAGGAIKRLELLTLDSNC